MKIYLFNYFPPSYFLWLIKKNCNDFLFNWKPNLCQLSCLMSLSFFASFKDLFTGYSVLCVCQCTHAWVSLWIHQCVYYIEYVFHCTTCRLKQLWRERFSTFAPCNTSKPKWKPNSLLHLRLTLIDNQTSLHIRHLWDQLNYLFNVTQLYATLVHQSTVIPDS